MADCSLCGGSISSEGGAILFTDKWGIPFEVCGTCEEQADILQNSKDETEIKNALGYITAHAGTINDRNNYESIMSFVKESAPQIGVEGIVEDIIEDKQLNPESIKAEKKSRKRDFLLLILLVFLLILACVLSGYKF